MIEGLNHSPYFLIKKALSSRFKLHNLLESLRKIRHRHCPPIVLDSDGNFILSDNPVNNLFASSFNLMDLGHLNYRICDFLNSSHKHGDEDSVVASDLISYLSESDDDLEVDHNLCNQFIAANAMSNRSAVTEILPFHIKYFDKYKPIIIDKIITKGTYLSQHEQLCMIYNAIEDECEEDEEKFNEPQVAVLMLNDLDDSQFTRVVSEGLNFVRKYGKPAVFILKFHDLHSGVLVLPLPEVNKYKFLAIHRALTEPLKRALNKMRNIAFEFELLRDDYLISGQYLCFDYNFKANMDIKILLSVIKILPYYKNDELPHCATKLLDALDEWNTYPFSTIEEHLNYLYSGPQRLRYSV
mgnify:CR=1 FL=1